LIHTFDPHNWSTHSKNTKKRYWTSNPSHEFQDWLKKNSFLETGPRFISYRLSHKRAKLANPLKTSSCDGRTDGQKSADNTVWKYAKKGKSREISISRTKKLSKNEFDEKLFEFKSSRISNKFWKRKSPHRTVNLPSALFKIKWIMDKNKFGLETSIINSIYRKSYSKNLQHFFY
jgi:hypothetical protein